MAAALVVGLGLTAVGIYTLAANDDGDVGPELGWIVAGNCFAGALACFAIAGLARQGRSRST